MPFLSFLLKVVPLQNIVAQTGCDPFCIPLYQAMSRILAGDGETRATSSRLSHAKTHVTVALVEGDRDQRSIRVTVGGQDALLAVEMLLSALTEQPVWHCGSQSYKVLSVDIAAPPLATVCTWSDLLAPSSSLSELRLHFVTPAVFARVVKGSVPAEVFPQPLQVFSSLLLRWGQLGGPALACEVLSWLQRYECVVSDYWLKARPIGLITGAGAFSVYPGWTGRISYSCREPLVPYMSALRALARLACFTGVGDYTEVGLGVTRIVENE